MGVQRWKDWYSAAMTLLDSQHEHAVTPGRVWNMTRDASTNNPILLDIIERHQENIPRPSVNSTHVTQEMVEQQFNILKAKTCEAQPFDRQAVESCRIREGETCITFGVRIRQCHKQLGGVKEMPSAVLQKLKTA